MPEPMIIRIEPVRDWSAAGARWKALEAACETRFFRSWTFLGCLAADRYGQAFLLSVTLDGQDVALALLGQRGRSTLLNETGEPRHDALFIEHNGLLVRPGLAQIVAPALREALRHFPALALSGIDDLTLAAAHAAGSVRLHITRFAPAADLTPLEKSHLVDPHLASLSSNARAQIRRAFRRYPAPPTLARAANATEALAWFEDLVTLHQASWKNRGRPGAFADPAILAFHRALLADAVPAGQADLLRITAGKTPIGSLYCFLAGTRAMSYQSGFASDLDPKAKPGLVCHTLAIDHYRARNMTCYDLLGGADRYKLTLAKTGEELHWVTLYRTKSWRGLFEESKRFFFEKKKQKTFDSPSNS